LIKIEEITMKESYLETEDDEADEGFDSDVSDSSDWLAKQRSKLKQKYVEDIRAFLGQNANVLSGTVDLGIASIPPKTKF
jgi:hypothetical protein